MCVVFKHLNIYTSTCMTYHPISGRTSFFINQPQIRTILGSNVQLGCMDHTCLRARFLQVSFSSLFDLSKKRGRAKWIGWTCVWDEDFFGGEKCCRWYQVRKMLACLILKATLNVFLFQAYGGDTVLKCLHPATSSNLLAKSLKPLCFQ